jgi:hypothetical protein
VNVQWRKLGWVYCASGESSWAISHAFCPTAFMVEDGSRIRVLCAFLDSERVGRCGWVDVEVGRPDRVVDVSRDPALDVGRPGAFDEHGVTPLSVVRLHDRRLRLYYAGWQRGVGVRYTLFLGAAESEDEGVMFRRVSEAPVLDRADGELYVRTGAFVRADGDGWQMWYAGGDEWLGGGADARPCYSLRHVRSADGIVWPRHGDVCLTPRDDELGFGRPCVLSRDNALHMWFSRRALDGRYQLAYASSLDNGLSWNRDDGRGGLELGPPGAWDAEMVGLSSMLETGDATYLFYNGNNYGETGFGVAVGEGL